MLEGGPGSDILYGGDGLFGGQGEDVIYGGGGNDSLGDSTGGQRDKLYCGEGRDRYFADPNDYVDSSCETASVEPQASARSVSADPCNVAPGCGHDVVGLTSSASASPVPVPASGGTAILPLAAALLLGSGILTYAILRRR